MLTLAIIFAANNKVSGQTYIKHVEGAPGCAPAIPLTCATASNALNPTPGQTYNYKISTDPATVGSVLFFVTDANPVITAGELTTDIEPNGGGVYILSATAGVYNVAGSATDIDISWQYFDGVANEVLVVAYVTGASGCSDEIEVWRIRPSFSFTLDVLSMADDGSLGTVAVPASECVSQVESATYNDPNLTMDYGENWVFFMVNAANFTGSWMPDLTVTPIAGKTIGAVEWAYPADAVSDVASGWHATGVPVNASAAATNGIVGATGECIIVRVEIQHNGIGTPRSPATETVTLNVNGVMYDAAAANYTNLALRDVDEGASGCDNTKTDKGEFTLLSRPTINPVSPTSFVNKN